MEGSVSTKAARCALLLAAAFGALAIAAPSAGAAAPVKGCTQTNSPAPGEPSEWTCYESAVTVSGYEVQQSARASIPKPPGVNGAITHMEVDVVDGASGQPVPINRLMLHHIVFFNHNRSDALCGGPERFYAAGEERAKISFPEGFGYKLNSGDTWSLLYMLMNHRRQTDTAFIEYKMTVDPDPSIRSTRSYWMDVGDCTIDPIYNVPGLKPKAAAANPGATHDETDDVTVKEDGWIVTGAGHVHGGARRLTINKPDCGNLEVAHSVPTWGLADHPFYNVRPILHEPGPIGMSAFSTPSGIPVTDGQRLRLNSLYDNTRPHTRVMGIFVVYVAPWKAGDPAPQECGGAPGDIAYGPGTNLPGRSSPPKFEVPLTGLDSNLNAITIDGPPGPFASLLSGATVDVRDRAFSRPNVRIPRGSTLNYSFGDSETHNVTLANGPLGIGSPNFNGGGSYSQTFNRAGTYRFFCSWHPVQMTERVVVTDPAKQAAKERKRKQREKKRKQRRQRLKQKRR